MDILREAFRVLARVRRARAFHPRGATYSGRVEISGPGPLPVGRHACHVRLSKGIGTPRRFPDLLGIAVRVEGVDFLVTTCVGTHGWRRLVLSPVTRWHRARLSTLMPLRSADGEQVQVLVEVDDARLVAPDPVDVGRHLPVRMRLRVAGVDRDLQTGELVLEAPAADVVAFDPMVNAPAGWRMGPQWLARARETAYVGSRAGRPGVREVVTPPREAVR